MVSAIDLKGLPLGEAPFAFKSRRHARPKPTIDLPVEIRNDVARLEIAGERSAGAVQLLDKRWRRRTVGIVSGSAADRSQPLIGATYYLSRALNPFADVRLAEGVAPGRSGHALPRPEPADAGARRCRQCRRGARASRQMDRRRRRAGALRRSASGRRQRRSRAGETAPRRPHSRRQPELGKAAAARAHSRAKARSTACRCRTTSP